MQSTLLSVALAGLLVLSGCLGTVTGDGAPAVVPDGRPLSTVGGDLDGPSISVSATGQVSADADLAVVRVSVVGRADTADAAREAVARDATRMRQALRDAGIPDDAVRTVSFSLFPEYEYTERERTLVGYQAVHAFAVEVAPDRAGEVVDVAVGNGADTVDSVQFTLTDETRERLRSQALTEAMNAARVDADAIARAADLSVSGVHSVSTSGDVGPVPFARFDAASEGGSTILEPGPVTVSATVNVVYTAA